MKTKISYTSTLKIWWKARRSKNKGSDESYPSSSEMALMCEEAETTKACVERFINQCTTDSMRRSGSLAQSIENFRRSSAQLEEACNHDNIENLAAVTQNILSVDAMGCDATLAMQPCGTFGALLQEKAQSLLRSSLNVLLGGYLTIDLCREGLSTQACSEVFLLRCVPDSLRTSEPIIQQIQSSRRNAAKVHSSCKRTFGALIPDIPGYDNQNTMLLSST